MKISAYIHTHAYTHTHIYIHVYLIPLTLSYVRDIRTADSPKRRWFDDWVTLSCSAMCAQSWSSLSYLVFLSCRHRTRLVHFPSDLTYRPYRPYRPYRQVPSHCHTDTVRDHATPIARNLLRELMLGFYTCVCPDAPMLKEVPSQILPTVPSYNTVPCLVFTTAEPPRADDQLEA